MHGRDLPRREKVQDATRRAKVRVQPAVLEEAEEPRSSMRLRRSDLPPRLSHATRRLPHQPRLRGQELLC